jgi:hypothetical protein
LTEAKRTGARIITRIKPGVSQQGKADFPCAGPNVFAAPAHAEMRALPARIHMRRLTYLIVVQPTLLC